jgi:hypothetical protein
MPPRMDFWDSRRTEMLTDLWNQGLSCTDIAAQIGAGTSRNAVIGKVHRLKLKRTTGRENQPRKERKPRPAPREKRIPNRQHLRSVFRSPEIKPRVDMPARKTGFVMVVSVLTGNPLMAKKRRPLQREMSKTELTEMLRAAVQNTANMGEMV